MIDAFYTLHRDLSREGPGEAADVEWAAALAKIGARARIADVACGPGGDIAALLAAAPEGHVTAFDKTPHFVAAARTRRGADARVTVLQADMAAIHNSYDMIWCAGAVYFLGMTEALKTWRKAFAPGGLVAFSEPCWFTEIPPARARARFADYPEMTDAEGITERVEKAGYEVIGTQKLRDAAWEAYYGPLDTRIATMKPGADAALHAVLAEAEEELATWRAHRDAFGYLLTVASPR